MPISLEPGQKFPVVLDIDADKPKDKQPTFWARSQSMRGQASVAEVLDELTPDTDKTAMQLFESICKKLAEVFCEWSNMGTEPISESALMDVLNYSEARELLTKVMYNQHVTPEEKKSSESQP